MVMDFIIFSLVSAVIIFMIGYTIIYELYTIGKPRDPLTADEYLFHMFISFMAIILVGRVLGWW